MKKYCLIAMLAIFALPAVAGDKEDTRSLAGMERERAALVNNMLVFELTPLERERKLSISSRRLVDMERMVIRDDRLLGSTSPMVKAAFKDYDRSFLVHAAAEHKRHVMDHWFSVVGLDTDAIMTSQKRYR